MQTAFSPPPEGTPPGALVPLGASFFPHPEPRGPRKRIWPVYLTYQGCPGRCVFCAQHLQSGQAGADLAQVLTAMEEGLSRAGQAGRGPYELAFYGGVFTALPSPWPERFLAAAARSRAQGLVSRVRCSTRPDACDPAVLERLRAAGLDLVEIGAQTFRDPVLTASGRRHDAASIRRAARAVRETGLELGLQLLPGLPGHTPADLADDIGETVALRPKIVRLHPCLVVRGTPLAALYRAGRYQPWDLDTTMAALARALPPLWRAGIRVTRIGLTPEPALQEALVAGPWHPDLGGRVRARATFALLAEAACRLPGPLLGLAAPRRFHGLLLGHRRELLPAYTALGLSPERMRFEDRPDFALYTAATACGSSKRHF